ncbi:MAG: hypothetical protein GY944_13230 [bacterium]|nr:hypothetical protein [bacterium]
MLTDDHLRSMAHWANTGADTCATWLRENHTEDSGLEVRDVRCTTLADLPDRIPCFEGECVAGVASRYSGELRGTALFAMDPEDALAWVRANPRSEDTLGSFVRLGDSVQNALVRAIGDGLGFELESESAELREDSVPLILFGTHAPSDTAVVCISALVAAGDHVMPVQVYLMVEPKLLSTALAA